MSFQVTISAQAQADLRGIYEYIAFALSSPENAASQLERLEAGIMGLAQMPNRFRSFESEPWRSRGLRMMPVDHYIVFYIPDARKNCVTVVRVFYGGRDTEAQMKRYTEQ